MSLSVVLFTVIALAAAVSALGVVLSQNIVRSAVWLLFTLIAISLLYFLLGAEFLGAAQLIVYVGGTMVLVVFGVMLTSAAPGLKYHTRPVEWAVSGLLAVTLFGLLVNASLGLAKPEPTPDGPLPGVEPLGLTFLGVQGNESSAFLLPFEIVSIHLLVVLVAAAYLARAKRKSVG